MNSFVICTIFLLLFMITDQSICEGKIMLDKSIMLAVLYYLNILYLFMMIMISD